MADGFHNNTRTDTSANAAGLFDRVPPHDDNAEMATLGGMLMSKDAIGEVSQIVSVDDFYEPKHQTIYEAIIGKFSASEPADAVTVANRLSDSGDLDKVGGIDYLHSLIASVPTAANASYYAEIVHQRALLRRVIASGTKIAQLGYDAEGSQAQDVINMAQAEVYEMSTGRVRQDYAPVQAAVHDALDQIDSIQKGELQAGVPTGFQEIDEVTKGLQPGQMVVVAGRPAMGKSTLGVDFARSAAIHHHDTTILFSLEMSKVELAQRIISAETGVPLAALRNADDIDPNRWNTLNNFYARLQDAPLFIDDSPNMSLMEIRAKCRRLKQTNDLKLHDLGQGRGKPPAGGLRVLARTQAACQGARGAGGGVEPAQPWPGNAQRQETAAFRPARIRLHRAGRRRGVPRAPPGLLRRRGPPGRG